MISNQISGGREYDIVLFGATGFVGRLTADYIVRHLPASARFAVAGRDEAKLQRVVDDLAPIGRHVEAVIVDAVDQAALNDVARRTTVLASTVGPYTEHGSAVVQACVGAGTDYLDLAGEPLFVRDSIGSHHDAATRSGSRIVHSSGFDSVPSDLLVKLLADRVHADGQGALTETVLVVRAIRGGISGGTVASGLAHARTMSRSRAALEAARDPYTLSHRREGESEFGSQPDGGLLTLSSISPELRGWAGAFFMGFHNTRIVRRSNTLTDWSYGPRFTYTEVMAAPGGPASVVLAALMTAGAMGMYRGVRALAVVPVRVTDVMTPRRGSGPSVRARAKGHFDFATYSTAVSGAHYRAEFVMNGDPGYAATAVILGESALAMAFDRDRLGPPGVVTPSVAMGGVLTDRLRAAGARISVTRID